MMDIQVDVETTYVEHESDVRCRRHFFAYTIRIANRGDAAAQLLDRHWLVTDGDGGVREVRGAGVVGQQPRIEPGASYVYTSACILETPVGSMRGSYGFAGDDGARFEVPIPLFTLHAPSLVH